MPAMKVIGNSSESAIDRWLLQSRWVLGLLLVLPGAAALASEQNNPYADLHEPLEISAELSWAELVEQTLNNYPRFLELTARDAEARALADRGHKWFSGQPSVLARYQTDRIWDNNDLREYELGLELPLWRLGQRQAARSLGAAAGDESGAAALALRHEVVGLLRMALWDIERADNAVALAEDGVAVAAELVRVVEHRYEAGDLPLSDTLLVRSMRLEREAVLIEGEAAHVDAERAYQSLSGLDVRPATFSESLSLRDDFDASHPWLMLADAEVGRARAELELVDRAARGTPTLTIGPRRERAPFETADADSIGITFAMPFGGQAHRTVQVAAAGRELARAEVERAQLLRQLDLDLHEARHSLVVIDESLELARERYDLATTSLPIGESAFAQGEITLFELLRWQETARIAQREAESLEIERQRAIAQINQAIGERP
jgi:cobalt-zinc-cadmium efflux system outer membrane protein